MRPRMSLSRYLELVSRLPAPTTTQIEAFAAKIPTERSWYKHLPILPPGRSFCFFLDPGAGMTRTVRHDGQFAVRPRTEEDCRRHHWPSTADTLSQFGNLTYFVEYPRVDVQDHDLPSLLEPDLGIDVWLPQEATQAARTHVSGLIHPNGTDHQAIARQARPGYAGWPLQSGGQDMAKKVLARCQELVSGAAQIERAPGAASLDSDARYYMRFSDWKLYRMLESERRRQQEGLVQAAARAVAFAHGQMPGHVRR